MKNYIKFSTLALSFIVAANLFSCSNDKDDEPKEKYHTTTIDFSKVPAYLRGGPTTYGANLYYGAQDQITTGYLAQIYGGKYAQFSINYGQTFDADFNSVMGYSFYNGGLAVSSWHDMTDDTYMNQLSVYNTKSPGGGNFVVANGSSTVTNPEMATLSDYDGCAKVYITNAEGYYVANPGAPGSTVTGDEEDAYFESVMINNTTYPYMVMKNGNAYSSALNAKNKGWFKVQFIAFDDNKPSSKPLGYKEAYLANFDSSLNEGKTGIISDWTKVDLSKLPEASVLVINFVGSDMGEYGLNTPAYCALDHFVITVED